MPLARLVAGYAFGWFLQSEDLPNPESRVIVRDGQIVMHWQRSNMAAHQALIARTKAVMKRAAENAVAPAAAASHCAVVGYAQVSQFADLANA